MSNMHKSTSQFKYMHDVLVENIRSKVIKVISMHRPGHEGLRFGKRSSVRKEGVLVRYVNRTSAECRWNKYKRNGISRS